MCSIFVEMREAIDILTKIRCRTSEILKCLEDKRLGRTNAEFTALRLQS